MSKPAAAEITVIPAKSREASGTGAARAVRRTGDIPAVIYGQGGDSRAIRLSFRDMEKPYNTGRFTSTLFVLDVEGEKIRVIPREVQVDPVTDRPIHADFQRLVPGSSIRLFIPVHFNNHTDSPGLKRGGVRLLAQGFRIGLICRRCRSQRGALRVGVLDRADDLDGCNCCRDSPNHYRILT